MALTVNITLRNRANSEGKYPLIIRVTKDRKSSIVHLGKFIEKRYWDQKNRRVRPSHPNSSRLNAFLIKKLAEVNDIHLEKELKGKETHPRDVNASFKGQRSKATFFTISEEYLRNLKQEGKYNCHTTDRSRIEHFKSFMMDRGSRFEDVNVQNLAAYKAFLKGAQKVSERTAINYLLLIRTIYNKAVAAGVVDRSNYPFGKGKIQIKLPDADKVGLTKEEVRKLIDFDLEAHPKHAHARNIWLVAFYLAGMRVSDVLRLRWSDIRDGRLYYAMGKNNKVGSLKLPEQAAVIIAQYKDEKRHKDDVIFPELKIIKDFSDKYLVQRKISYGIKNINKYLKLTAKMAKIDKPLTMHIARHSFAGISGEKVSIQILQKLYRHSNITTTIAYQNSFTTRDIDEALDAVVDF